MIEVVNKLDLGEPLNNRDWKILIAHEFNCSKSTAREAFHGLISYIKKEEHYKRMFNPIEGSEKRGEN